MFSWPILEVLYKTKLSTQCHGTANIFSHCVCLFIWVVGFIFVLHTRFSYLFFCLKSSYTQLLSMVCKAIRGLAPSAFPLQSTPQKYMLWTAPTISSCMNAKSSLIRTETHLPECTSCPSNQEFPGSQNPAPAAPPRQCDGGVNAQLWSEGPGLESQLCNLPAAFASWPKLAKPQLPHILTIKVVDPQNIKQSYHRAQKFHSWAYTQEN